MNPSGSNDRVRPCLRGGPLALLVALVGGLCLSGWGAPSVAAHAALAASDPEHNAVLANPPARVTLRFTERLERSYSRAELYDQDGNPVPGAESRAGDDAYTMVLDLPPDLPQGTYSVLWRTLSADDGHTLESYIAFTVGTQADVSAIVPPTIAEDEGPPGWLKTATRWTALLGLAAAVAIWPVWLAVLRPAISPAWQAGPALAHRAHRFAGWAVVLALAGSAFALSVQAATLAGDGGYLDQLVTTLGQTRYGRLWFVRIGLLLLYAVALTTCAWWWPRRRKVEAALALGLAAALPIPFSLIAHAAAQPAGRTVAVANDVLHLLAAALWVGGLFVLVAVLLPTLRDLTPLGRRAVLARALPRFSALALTAWAVMGLTGLYSAWLQVGNLAGLRETSYGRALTLKLLLLVPVLALAAFNLLVVTRRLQRATADARAPGVWTRRFALAVGAEAALVVVVFLVVGRLIWQQPARDVLAERAEWVTLDFEAGERPATLYLSPGAAGVNHFRIEVDGEALPTETAALLRIELPSQDTGEKEIGLTRAAGNAFEHHGSELGIAGDWTIQLVVRPPGAAQWSAIETLALPAAPPAAGLPGPPWRFAPAGGLPGLLLVPLGIAGLALAWQAGRSPLRKESAGVGAVALALGALLLLQARLDPAEATRATADADPAPADAAAIARGRELFLANCAACHGAGGRGDGPAAAGLDPPPADLTSAHARSHADQDFFYWIENGIEDSAMPAFGDELTDEEIRDVVTYVRALQSGIAAPGGTPAAIPAPSAPVAQDDR